MRMLRCVFTIALALLFSVPTLPQQSSPAIQRDPQALAVLQQCIIAMGGSVPTDSVAAGTIVIVEGSATESGTIRLLTRGLEQTATFIETSEGRRSIIYTHGRASEVMKGPPKELLLELVVTSHGPDFPIVVVASALTTPDMALEYSGVERLRDREVHHIRFWQTFPGKPGLRHLEEFSTRDIWIDAASGLPLRLAYQRRAALGPEAPVAMEVSYADYRNVGGVLYPFRTEKDMNGTPWATVSIERVTFNNGLTDADFPIR